MYSSVYHCKTTFSYNLSSIWIRIFHSGVRPGCRSYAILLNWIDIVVKSRPTKTKTRLILTKDCTYRSDNSRSFPLNKTKIRMSQIYSNWMMNLKFIGIFQLQYNWIETIEVPRRFRFYIVFVVKHMAKTYFIHEYLHSTYNICDGNS